nr:S1 RNA-binding domain-containing protein [Actinomycetota bacterium]
LPAEVLGEALQQARQARLHILEVMSSAIPEPRPEVAASAPKIVSLEIPIDRIGEVIGPKGKVINALQQETGANINVDDDGMVGTVTIGSKDGLAVQEARRRIELILDPPSAEVGATYDGKVVNVTKFGAFVNILPGRDGLVHISKLGQGRRVERVEDVLNLGDDVKVRVDDIDQQGKVSLSPAGEQSGPGAETPAPAAAEPSPPAADPEPPPQLSEPGIAEPPAAKPPVTTAETVSFDDVWEQEAAQEFGDLGPAESVGGRRRPGGDRENRGERGDRGPRRNPRRSGGAR